MIVLNDDICILKIKQDTGVPGRISYSKAIPVVMAN
jgi:hypothetical protein